MDNILIDNWYGYEIYNAGVFSLGFGLREINKEAFSASAHLHCIWIASIDMSSNCKPNIIISPACKAHFLLILHDVVW